MSENDPKLVELRIEVCEPCVRRDPGECHAPGCFYRLHGVEDVPTHLDAYALSPTHVVVAKARLARLEAIEKAVHEWTNVEIDDRQLVEAVVRADGAS